MRLLFAALAAFAPSLAAAQGDGPFCKTYVQIRSTVYPCAPCRLSLTQDPATGRVSVVSNNGWTAELTDMYRDYDTGEWTSGEGTGRWNDTADEMYAGKTFGIAMGTQGTKWLAVEMAHEDPDYAYSINFQYRCTD